MTNNKNYINGEGKGGDGWFSNHLHMHAYDVLVQHLIFPMIATTMNNSSIATQDDPFFPKKDPPHSRFF